MQWRVEGSTDWHGVKVNEEEAQFFADLRAAQLSKGEHKVIFRMQDAHGNQSEHKQAVVVTI